MQLTVRTGRLGAAAGATGGGGDGGAGSVVSAAIRLIGDVCKVGPATGSTGCYATWRQGGLVGGSGGLLFSSSPGLPFADLQWQAAAALRLQWRARCLCVRTSRSSHGYLSPVSTCVWYDQPFGIKLHDDHGRRNQSDCRLNMDLTVLPWLAVFTDSRECSLFTSSVSLSLQVFLT